MLRRSMLLGVCLLVGGCAAPTVGGGPVAIVRDASANVDPEPPRKSPPDAEPVPPAADCEEPPATPPPEWAAGSNSPVPTDADLTGSWLPINNPSGSSNSHPPGLVKWQPGCHSGHAMLVLEQDGQTLRGTWSSRARTPGMPPEVQIFRGELVTGERNGDELSLEGTRVVRTVVHYGSTTPGTTCTPLTYLLTYEPKTKRLVGTENGEPVAFAPAHIGNHNPGQVCGPPPA